MGLSQSQVAGSDMTRNMLSQLEHDLASPSVKTLLYLADRLHVSQGWLLDDTEEQDIVACTEEARSFFQAENYTECLRILSSLGTGIDEEARLLLFRSAVASAEQTLQDGRYDDADRLLQYAERCKGLYIGDEEVFRVGMLRLRWNLSQDQPDPELLQKVTDLSKLQELRMIAAEHDLLSGRKAVEMRCFSDALPYLHRAENAAILSGNRVKELYFLLEQCYKEQEDYKQAYRYASLRLEYC